MPGGQKTLPSFQDRRQSGCKESGRIRENGENRRASLRSALTIIPVETAIPRPQYVLGTMSPKPTLRNVMAMSHMALRRFACSSSWNLTAKRQMHYFNDEACAKMGYILRRWDIFLRFLCAWDELSVSGFKLIRNFKVLRSLKGFASCSIFRNG